MGRQQGLEPGVLHSSIALLQERFRKLERVKEMREERELLRLFAEPEGQSPNASFEQPKWFFHPDLVHPSMHLRAPAAAAVAPIRLEPHGGGRMKFRVFEASLSMGLRPDKPGRASLDKYEDVDTSLHL